ncbi:MAG TPA: M28 family peptidase [Candidatus Xenobia bacterium]|jgi:hypothetical protein
MRFTWLCFFTILLWAPAWSQRIDFDTSRALDTMRELSVHIGIRHGGSEAEHRAARFLVERLQSYGYRRVHVVPFVLPNGRHSQDVWVDKPGADPRLLLVGAHMDSKGEAPGANDNASGCGVVLELARDMAAVKTHETIRFMFFGSEEIINPQRPSGHHFGSRYYVQHDLESDIDGMICIDAVANGGAFVIGNMEDGSPLAAALRQDAVHLGYHPLDQTDPGWSDHEPFEKAGVTVAYVRWRVDDHLHTRYDTMQYVHGDKVAAAGRTVLAELVKH